MPRYRQRSSSRSTLTTATISPGPTLMVSSSWAIEWANSAPLRASAIVSAWWWRASSRAVAERLALDRPDPADLFLQQHHAVEQCLGDRPTARYIDVHRYD